MKKEKYIIAPYFSANPEWSCQPKYRPLTNCVQFMIEAGQTNSTYADTFCKLNLGVGSQYYNITEPYDKGTQTSD